MRTWTEKKISRGWECNVERYDNGESMLMEGDTYEDFWPPLPRTAAQEWRRVRVNVRPSSVVRIFLHTLFFSLFQPITVISYPTLIKITHRVSHNYLLLPIFFVSSFHVLCVHYPPSYDLASHLHHCYLSLHPVHPSVSS